VLKWAKYGYETTSYQFWGDKWITERNFDANNKIFLLTLILKGKLL